MGASRVRAAWKWNQWCGPLCGLLQRLPDSGEMYHVPTPVAAVSDPARAPLGEMIVTKGIEYDYTTSPQLVKFSEATVVVDVSCGTNHSVALTDDGRVFTWGFGGYGRLGINSPADQMQPVPVTFANQRGVFVTAVSAGATCCYATSSQGQLFFWGRTKSTGEATMYPKVGGPPHCPLGTLMHSYCS